MKNTFLLLCLLTSFILLFSSCQKTFDPLSPNTIADSSDLTVGSNWTYSYKEGASVPDTFTLTVTNKDTVINGRTYKVLTSSHAYPNNYLASIDYNNYRYPSFLGNGLENFEELYLKDNLLINETWTNSTRFFTTESSSARLVGLWEMDEGSGTSLTDASNYRNNATISGNPAWVAGVTGQALKLDGINQYASVPDNASLNITGEITLAAWIKPERQATQDIIKKAINRLTNGYELALSADGHVFFRFNQATSLDSLRLNSTGFYPDDGETWMHVAATYDGSSIIKIYINGVENGSKALTAPPPISTNDLPLAIGAQSDGSRKFLGTIDDVRIYNSALSASEIRNFIYSDPSASDTLTADLKYTVKEKSISHVVRGKTYNNVTHISLNITVGSTIDIGGGDFYYAKDIGLIENNIQLTPPGQSSFTSKQELIAYEIK